MPAKNRSGMLLVAILVLVLINLALTTVVLMRQSSAPDSAVQLAPDLARGWGEKVVQLYNRRDADALYALFGTEARRKISKQQLVSELDKLHRLFGRIESHSYVNSVKLGEKGGERYYQMFFNAQVSESSTRATLTVSVIEGRDSLSLYGLRLSGADSSG